ncbi:DUF2746 domain-containing protein [Actinomycetaceae bacterium L2_0104]
MPPEVQAAVTTPEILTAISTLIVIFLGVVTAKLTSKLKQIQEDTAEAKEQVTNSHSVNFRDEVTQIGSDVKVISATLRKISEIQRSQGHQIGEIKDYQIQESRDRQAVDARLQALDRRAQSEHASIWEALRKQNS